MVVNGQTLHGNQSGTQDHGASYQQQQSAHDARLDVTTPTLRLLVTKIGEAAMHLNAQVLQTIGMLTDDTRCTGDVCGQSTRGKHGARSAGADGGLGGFQ